MAKTLKIHQRRYFAQHNKQVREQSYPPLNTSNIQLIYTSILDTITSDKPAKLKNLLTQKFIFESHHSDYESRFVNLNHWSAEEYAFHYQQPIMEVLFLHHKNLFLDIVDKVLAKNNTALYDAFQRSIHHPDLTEVNHAMLFSLNLTGIDAALSRLQQYGRVLITKDASTKSTALQGITHTLLTQLNTFRSEKDDSQPTNVSDSRYNFETLQFKLQLSKTLHEEDNILAVHRHWRIATLLGNLIRALFPRCDFFKHTDKHRWSLLSNKTSSERAIDCTEQSMYVEQESKALRA